MPNVTVDADLLVEDGVGGERQLNTDDFKTDETGAATETTLLAVLAALGATVTVDGEVSLDAATLAALENISVTVTGSALPSGAATSANQSTVIGHIDGLETAFATLNAKDFATQTTLASVLASVDGLEGKDYATQATLAAVLAAVDGLEGNTTGLATQVTAAAILAKLIAAPSTEAKQDTGNTSLASLNGKDFALDATLQNRYGGGKTAVTATVTSSGATTIHTPASGNAIRLYWASAINDPDQETSPLIQVKVGATELYRGYALSHWEVFEGAADETLTVTLDGAASVAFTAHLEEF